MTTRLVIGVTGGIGSGKSLVCNTFAARHGIVVIDADGVAREVVAPAKAGLAEVVAAFGPGVLAPDGHSTAPGCAGWYSPTNPGAVSSRRSASAHR